MPVPPLTIGNNPLDRAILFFKDLASQKAFKEKLGDDIPVLETNHVLNDYPADSIDEAFAKLEKEAGLR